MARNDISAPQRLFQHMERHIERRADRRAEADIARLAPLEAIIHENISLLDCPADAEPHGQVAQRLVPEPVFLPACAEAEGELHERVARAEQRVHLHDRFGAFPEAVEGDPPRYDVTLDADEAEGGVGDVENHQPRRDHEPAGEPQVENGHRAGGNRCPVGGEKAVPSRPEIGEFRFPQGDDLARIGCPALDAQAVSLVPEPSEAFHRARRQSALDVDVHRLVGDPACREALDGASPAGLERSLVRIGGHVRAARITRSAQGLPLAVEDGNQLVETGEAKDVAQGPRKPAGRHSGASPGGPDGIGDERPCPFRVHVQKTGEV